MKYRLVDVNNEKTIHQFHEVVRQLYKGDPNFICPLDSIVEGVFTPEKNTFFSHGEACRWILVDENGKLSGRVAAFINSRKAFTFQQPTGGMGFFESVRDKDAAFLLFDICRQWLEERGMQAMDGPINFGENDNFWGLLVEGFMPQSFGMNYNPPYYREYFESYGFAPYFEQVTNHLDMNKPFPERFWKIADWVRQKPEYNFRHFDLKQTDAFLGYFLEVYNDAWQFHENFTPMQKDALVKTIEDLKAIMIPDFIWFAFHGEEPIAFEVMIPDINQLFRYFNGKPTFWGKLRIALKGKNKILTRSRITIMGVKPKYQKSGIESALFWHMDKMMKRFPNYQEVELSWVGDFNPKMRMLHESVGASFAKKHITYRKLFSEQAGVVRSRIIPTDTREMHVSNLKS
ncbi:MAG: GNAT family N-acetyltransferase [Bacteroidales bacterium]|nr:GNAT family N-acetyltransferase [Bacteroidales bacterium]